MPTDKNGHYIKRGRTSFTDEQLAIMRREFNASPYLAAERRRHLALELELEEERIKVWFQNRRQKTRNRLGIKSTKRLHQEDADSTVTSPDGRKSILERGSGDLDRGARLNSYENYGFSDAEMKFHQNRVQKIDLDTESKANYYKNFPFGRQQRVSSHHSGNQNINPHVSNMRQGLRFNTHRFRRLNPLLAQHSGQNQSTMRSYPSATMLGNPLEKNEAGVAYNQNGFNQAQLTQNNMQVQMILQHQHLNGYRILPDMQFSQTPSSFKRDLNIPQSQHQVYQSLNSHRLNRYAQFAPSPSFKRIQPMTQYHSSEYINNNGYYPDHKPIFPVDLSNVNVLGNEAFKCKVEGSSRPQSIHSIANSPIPSCSYSNNIPTNGIFPKNIQSAYTHFDNSCQFETPDLKPPSSFATSSNVSSNSSLQNGVYGAPLNSQNFSGMPAYLTYHSSNSPHLRFPMNSSTRQEMYRTCEPPMNLPNTQVYQNVPPMSTVDPCTSGSSLPDQIPPIKDHASSSSNSNFPMNSSNAHGFYRTCTKPMNLHNTQVYQNLPSMSTADPNTSGSSLPDLSEQIPPIQNNSLRSSSSSNLSFPVNSSTAHGFYGNCATPMNLQNTQVYQNAPSMSTVDPSTSGSSLPDLCEQIPPIKDYSSSSHNSNFPANSSTAHGFYGNCATPIQNTQAYQNVPSAVDPSASGSSLPDQIPPIKDEILEHSSSTSATDLYSMSSVENLCEDLMAIQDNKDTVNFNDTYFLRGPNIAQGNNGLFGNNSSAVDTQFFENPCNSIDNDQILPNGYFDRDNACPDSNTQSSVLSKPILNNPASSHSQVSYNHAGTSTIPNGLNNFPSHSNTYSDSHQAIQNVVNTHVVNSVAPYFNNDSQISSTSHPSTFLGSPSCSENMAQLLRSVIEIQGYSA